MTQLVDEHTVIWRLHADKLMWIRDNGTHTAMVGFQMTASWFNNTPPNSLDIEYAIQLIEDGLLPLKQESFAVTDWLSDDKMFEQLSLRINHTKQISRDELEAYFQNLTQQLNRSAFQHHQLNNQEIAYVLVLREAMFHLDVLHMRFLG